MHTILGYVARQFNSEVEKLVKDTCWGFAYRDIGTSIDDTARAMLDGGWVR